MNQKTFRIRIKGARWKYRLLSYARFCKYHPEINPEDDPAVTDCGNKIIDFYVKDLDLIVVRHEIIHGFISELHIESASLSVAQIEEVIADLVAENWDEMGAKAKFMFARMEKFLDKIEEPSSRSASPQKKDAPL